MLSGRRGAGERSSASWGYGATPSGASSSQPLSSAHACGSVTPAAGGLDGERRNHLPPWHTPRQNSSARFSGVQQPDRRWSSSEGVLMVRPPQPHHHHNMNGMNVMGGRVLTPSSGMALMNQRFPQRRPPSGFSSDGHGVRIPGREQQNHDYRRSSSSSSSSSSGDSRLTKPEQEKALNKLKKQIYGPNPKTLIRNLGLYYRDMAVPDSTKTPRRHHSNDDEEGKRCAVCLEDFEPGTEVTVTPCAHMFHEECIVPWVKSHGQCPVCRFVMCEPSALQPPSTRRGTTSSWSSGDVGTMNRRRLEGEMTMMMMTPPHHHHHHNHHHHHHGDVLFADHLLEIIRAMEEGSLWQRTH